MCFSVLGAGDPGDDTIGKITTLMAHEFCQGRQIEKNASKKKKKIHSMAGVDESYRGNSLGHFKVLTMTDILRNARKGSCDSLGPHSAERREQA